MGAENLVGLLDIKYNYLKKKAMAKPNNPIDAWPYYKVNKIFAYHLDDMHPLDALGAKKLYVTLEDKRAYLIRVEEKFRKQFYK